MISLSLIAACLALGSFVPASEAIEELATFKEYKDSVVGYGGTKPKVYESYERVLEVATDQDLETALAHWSPVVRAYAFTGLLSRGHDADEVSAKLVGTAAELPAQFGCAMVETTLGDLSRRLIRHHVKRKKIEARSPPQ